MAGLRTGLASRVLSVACVLAAVAVAAAAAAPAPSMAMPTSASADVQAQRARDAKVVPDVVDAITPSVQLRVSYDGAAVASGEKLTVFQTAAKPQVSFQGADPASFYTFMLVDPDAPDPAEPVRNARSLGYHHLRGSTPDAAALRRRFAAGSTGL